MEEGEPPEFGVTIRARGRNTCPPSRTSCGSPGSGFGSARRQGVSRWRSNAEAPYFNEVFFDFKGGEEAEVSKVASYWIYDQVKNVLQRHHVQERKHRFIVENVLCLCKQSREAGRRMGRSDRKKINGAGWIREGTRNYWRGISEFAVDEAQLKTNNAWMAAGKRRGDGEIYEHEIKAEERELWSQSDLQECGKIVESGAFKVLPLRKESKRVRKEWADRGELNRILPTRMVRLKVGDLKSAFTQSPLEKICCVQWSGGHNDMQERPLMEVAPLHWRRTLRQSRPWAISRPAWIRALSCCSTEGRTKEALRSCWASSWSKSTTWMMGQREHDRKMEDLQRRFRFGKMENVDERGVGFNGRRLRMEKGRVLIDMEKFVSERMEEIGVSTERRKQADQR